MFVGRGTRTGGGVVQPGMRRIGFHQIVGAALAAILVLAACGRGPSVPTGAGSADGEPDGAVEDGAAGDQAPAEGELAFGLQRCDHDAPRLAAEPSYYRDEPIYVGNEQPTEEVRAWAQRQPGFEDIWIDRDHNGWITVGFSEGASDRQADLEAEFSGVGVVAVAVPVSDAELQALRSEVEAALDGLPSWASGHSVSRGRVEVSVPVLDEETLARLAPFAGTALCVDGKDPADAVIDGPQPTGGEGWRLLGTDRVGQAYRTGVATHDEQYADLWAESGLEEAGLDRPEVDFETEIVIWFGAVYGSSCPIRMDDVIVDVENRVIHGLFVLPGNPTACTDDANAEAYVVAIPRQRLPEAPFDVQLDADDPPRGAPEERTTVLVDLRPAGAVATGADLEVVTLEDFDPGPDRFEPGYVIEDGYPWVLAVDLHCSVDVIGPLNAVMWRAVDPALEPGQIPDGWIGPTGDDLVEAEFLLTSDPARLTITVDGATVTYDPIPAGEEAAMTCA